MKHEYHTCDICGKRMDVREWTCDIELNMPTFGSCDQIKTTDACLSCGTKIKKYIKTLWKEEEEE